MTCLILAIKGNILNYVTQQIKTLVLVGFFSLGSETYVSAESNGEKIEKKLKEITKPGIKKHVPDII